jgi:DNA polymerase I-like protein with 3'-5' exonuclease and polymerase domains
MIIKCDAAQLEWRVKVWMAQDETGIREIQGGEDLHTDNQNYFGLPSRLIAKIYIYRQIFADSFGDQGFRGPAYAYANDPDFMSTSRSVKYWEKVTSRFFEKYEGVYRNSVALIREATSTGRIVNPSGRFYTFEPYKKWNGTMDWPRTDILNYPVQGLSADFMSLARQEAHREVTKLGYGDRALFVNTVHDDLEMDVDNDPTLCYNISIELIKSFRKIPELFEKHYGVHVNVPFDAEIKMGINLLEDDMFKFKEKTFQQDWNNYIEKYGR